MNPKGVVTPFPFSALFRTHPQILNILSMDVYLGAYTCWQWFTVVWWRLHPSSLGLSLYDIHMSDIINGPSLTHCLTIKCRVFFSSIRKSVHKTFTRFPTNADKKPLIKKKLSSLVFPLRKSRFIGGGGVEI